MKRLRPEWLIVLIAGLIAGADFMLAAHRELDLMDESYLWYGVWRTALGEVPVRDFQAYDPLRYYWGALFVRLFGDGIVVMRFSSAVLQFAMLVAGLSVLRRKITSWPVLIAAAWLMAAWAYHAEKASGYLVAAAAVWVATLLIESPTTRRHLGAGMFVGVAALVGSNHGVYTLAIFTGIIALLWWVGGRDRTLARGGAFAGGVVLGYAPTLLMFLFVPGFFDATYTGLHMLVSSMAGGSGTNIGMDTSLPWPWRPEFAGLNLQALLRNLTYSVLAVLMLAAPVVVLAGLLIGRRLRRADHADNAPIYAAAACTLVYAQYFYSRSDYTHMADAIQPLLLLLCLTPFMVDRGRLRWIVRGGCGVLLVAALWLIQLIHPSLDRLRQPEIFQQVDIRGDLIWMRQRRAEEIHAIRRVTHKWVAEGEGVLFAPHRPGMYLVTNRRSPIRTIYFLGWQDESDARMIELLEKHNVNTALITLTAIDNRADLTFAALRPELNRYLKRHFKPVMNWAAGLPSYYRAYRRRPPIPPRPLPG